MALASKLKHKMGYAVYCGGVRLTKLAQSLIGTQNYSTIDIVNAINRCIRRCFVLRKLDRDEIINIQFKMCLAER